MEALFPTLLAKVSILLAMTMGTAAIGTYLGRKINSLFAFIVLLVLFLGGCFGVMIAAHAGTTAGILALAAWGFVTGLFMGPAIENYAEELGWQTVCAAFLGTAGAMVVCGSIGMFSGIDFSHMGAILGIALLVFIIASIVTIFVRIGRTMNITFASIGCIIFAGYFLFDFYRVSHSEDTWENATDMTVKIFLDFINFFLQLLKLLAAVHHK